ncbi:MAG: tocopherol cyclase family protein [Bacteriovorax sp.]
MKKILSLILFLSFSLSLHADVDPFNVYQYKQGSQRPWFEWWYYKVVLPETGESFFFVYGVVNPWDKSHALKGTRAYVGMGDFNRYDQIENLFPVEKFKAAYDQTLVEVENQQASDVHFSGSLEHPSRDQYSWDISINKDWSYNAAGWITGRGVTDIEWYPAQAGAHCSGTIISKNKLYQFTDAPCYQDRNWGTEFPSWWAWIVSNQFKENSESVLAIGGGKPKFHGNKLPIQGVSIGLHHKGIDYHFRPNDLDIVKTDISFGKWEMSGENDKYKVTVSAYAPKEKFMDLKFVTPKGLVFHDYETLTGKVIVKIYHKRLVQWKLVDTLTSNYAGIEYGSH